MICIDRQAGTQRVEQAIREPGRIQNGAQQHHDVGVTRFHAAESAGRSARIIGSNRGLTAC